MEFEAREGDEVEAGQDGEAALVVAHQAAEAHLPGEGALDDPAPGQQDEAALGLRQLDPCRWMPWVAASSAGCSPV